MSGARRASACAATDSSVPSVAALNMHYDQYRGLPALGSATNDLTDVYRSADVAAANLSRRLVFTVGCHSALDVPDALADAGDARALDFAQAYARSGAAAMIGNLGFGYADTTAVAYSVRQQQELAAGFAKGYDVAHVHIRHIWPMPKNMSVLLKGFDHILVPEMNTGQLKTVLRDQYLVDAKPLNKVSGQPFRIAEIEAAIAAALD